MNNLHVTKVAEKRVLHLLLCTHVVLTITHQRVNKHLSLIGESKELLALYSETIKTAAKCQHLVCLAVDINTHSLCKVEQRRELSVLLALLNDGVCC